MGKSSRGLLSRCFRYERILVAQVAKGNIYRRAYRLQVSEPTTQKTCEAYDG